MKKMRPIPSSNQRGFGLILFVIITAAIAFSILLYNSSVYIKKYVNEKQTRELEYISQVSTDIGNFWRNGGFAYDSVATGTIQAGTLLSAANISLKYSTNIVVSNPLTSSDGVVHRRVAIWIPSDLSMENPPDVSAFVASGVFDPCSNKDSDKVIACDLLKYTVFDSLDIEKELMKETADRLQRVALKAQAYFQARTYQDPDRDVSINRFIPNIGDINCTGGSFDPSELECMQDPTPLSSAINGVVSSTRSAEVLSLSNDELMSAWGTPIKGENFIIRGVISDANKPCAQTPGSPAPPYCMIFSADTPFGTTMSVTAVQQL